MEDTNSNGKPSFFSMSSDALYSWITKNNGWDEWDPPYDPGELSDEREPTSEEVEEHEEECREQRDELESIADSVWMEIAKKNS